jgi:hypothetical protein
MRLCERLCETRDFGRRIWPCLFARSLFASSRFLESHCQFSQSPNVAQRRTSVNELSAVCQEKSTHYIDQITNKISNSPNQMRAVSRGSPAYSSIALPSPSLSTHPVSSILIDSSSGDSLTAENYAPCQDVCCWNGKKLSNQCRCMSFVQRPAMIADGLDAM